MIRAARFCALFVLALAALPSSAVVPRVKWAFAARSNLYGSPIVADVHPSPGQETIVSDAEARLVRCVSAKGKLLWTFGGGWVRRVVNVPSLSLRAQPGRALLVVGCADRLLQCIDARDGKRVWARHVGGLDWGTAVWADLDGDGRDEVVAGTRADGIVALGARGRKLWRYRGEDAAHPIRIGGPIAASDVDGDGKAEVFACTALGPVCVGGDGKLRWSRLTGDGWPGAPLIADLDGDGAAEVVCASNEENALWCLDARSGAVKWRHASLSGADVYDASCLAIGDVDGDGKEEVVASDRAGHVVCLDAEGEVVWRWSGQTRAASTVVLGDVDGDGAPETLVASDDRSLCCLDWRGELKWRYAANRRLVFPPTICDVDQDGKTDILLTSCDRTLRCLTLDARYDARTVPWPSRRYDVAQTGSCFGKRDRVATRRVAESEWLLAPAIGTFDWGLSAGKAADYPKGTTIATDRPKRPRGWHIGYAEDARWSVDTDTKRTGRAALKLTGGDTAVSVTSDALALGYGLQTVNASVWCKGAGAGASLRWLCASGVLREDALVAEPAGVDGWSCLRAEALAVPRGARYLQMVLTANAEAWWWDDASLTGNYVRRVRLEALVNQVGYDLGAPKRFTVQTNLPGESGSFTIATLQGTVAYRGTLVPRGRTVGAYGSDWGSNYLRGDFTAFETPGRYRVTVTVDGVTARSWPFEVGRDVLWAKTARLAYRLFYYQRCGTAVPGFHGPCHLDGAKNLTGTRWYDLTGGWHDAGDYNPSETQVIVYGLAKAYAAGRKQFEALDRAYPPATGLRAEIPWGADQVRRMILPDGSAPGPLTIGGAYMGAPEIETDNLPRTGDERPVLMDDGQDPSIHVAALAKCARYVQPGDRGLLAAAERGMRWCAKQRIETAVVFDAALDLYAVTRRPDYAALARSLYPKVGLDDAGAAAQYDLLLHENHQDQIRARLVQQAEDILARAGSNPFGVYRYRKGDLDSYLWPPPPGGTEAEDGGGSPGGSNTDLMPAAITVAQAYRYRPDPRYRAFLYDQLNWVLGANPVGVCMLEGAGILNPPAYHACIAFAGVERGALPGGIVNGITWRGIADDRPYFDMRGLDIADWRTNEIWLPHSMRYLHMLAELMRGRQP